MAKRVKVRERKLGRDKAVGLYWGDGLIEIDPRLKPKAYLGTLLHELLHHVCPNASESWVGRHAPVMARVVWQAGFRKLAK
jgi:hypothetical protein